MATDTLELATQLGISTTLLNAIILIIVLIAIFDAVLKIVALWKSARRNQLVWFIFLAIVNSAGILPIIYLLVYRDKKKPRKK